MNYGFTCKRSYEESLKGHEFNYKQVPVIEQQGLADDGDEHPYEAVGRRIVVGRMGKASYVADDDQVNHAEGRYKKIARETLKSFCEHPVTHSLLFKLYVKPFRGENTPEECLWHLQNLEKISQRLADDRTWMAKQMCGVDVNELDERKKKKDKQSDR